MAQGRRTRILIVDDSAVMRSLLRSIICSDPLLEVAGAAADGESALGIVAGLHPDLMLLDVEMPVMDGLVTLRKLRAGGHHMPVIMCSSLTQRGARVTIEALAGGASDYVAKPAGNDGPSAATQALAQALLPKIHALAAVQDSPTHSADRPPSPALPSSSPNALPLAASRAQPATAVPSVVVVGVSTGGPAALDLVLPSLPRSFPLPVLIVQHMPELFTGYLAERLSQHCSLSVREACEGDAVRPGTIYLARGNWHLEVQPAARAGMAATLHLTQAPPENHCRPAVDVLFRTAAAVYGAGVLAVVLTGMGSDGLAGARVIRAQGGIVLAQDRATSTVWGMPGAVSNAGLAHRVLPLAAIASEVLRFSSRAQTEARELREAAV